MSPLFCLSFLTFASLAFATDFSVKFVSHRRGRIQTEEIPPAPQVLPLVAKVPSPVSKRHHRDALLNHFGGRRSAVPPVPLAGISGGTGYGVNITIGNQPFIMIMDTGSSDLWVTSKTFECFNQTGNPEPRSTCAFGSTFDISKSKTFKPYKDHNINLTYGGGEFLAGDVGFETVRVGGVEVVNQEFGLPNEGYWEGDNATSGILGLATPLLTSVFEGSDPSKDGSSALESYDPFFYNAVKQQKIKPFFSLSLDRSNPQQTIPQYQPNLGFLGLGGHVPVHTIPPTVTAPWLGLTTRSGDSVYLYYIVEIEGYTFPGSTSVVTASNVTILDSGTTLNLVPSAVAAKYNAAFIPPATPSDEYGGYYVVPCSAKVPPFEVTIGGKKFSIDAKDQLLPLDIKNDQGQDLCLTGTQDGDPHGGGNIYTLGSVFLHNVVTVFNVVNETVTIKQREKY